MKHRAEIVLLLMLATAVTVAGAQRIPQQQGMPGLPGNSQSSSMGGSIAGRVRAMDGARIANARVELTAIHGAQGVTSTYTDSNGNFEFGNLPSGDYELVVTQGLEQARETISVAGPFASVDIRLGSSTAPAAGGATSVSVAEMKVPDKARNHFHKAEAAMRKQKFDEVNSEVEKSLELAPNYANALTLRAVLRLDGDQPEQALTDAQKAINSDPNYAMAYIVCGATFNFMAKYDDAVRTLERGIALDPTSWQGYFEMSKALLAKQSYEASLRNVNRAFDLAPKD